MIHFSLEQETHPEYEPGKKVPMPYLSMVIPIYNESESIKLLYEELTAALEDLKCSYEVLAIDDGSTDDTYIQLKNIYEADPRWRILRMRRNFGQTAGLTAGFDAARGEIVVTIDADLQNDPRDIGKLLEKIDEGYDIVSGWRMNRKEPFVSRRLPSILANNLISRTTNVKLHDYGCTLKAYRSEVIKNIRLYGELHRFIPALASWMGIVVCEVPVSDRARRFGKSKYGISRTFRVILDLITVSFLLRFSTKPLHVFGGVGFVLGSLGSILLFILGFERLVLGQGIADRPLLLVGILLIILSVQMVSIGLVAEMVMRTYYETQGKTTYMIRSTLDAVEQQDSDLDE